MSKERNEDKQASYREAVGITEELSVTDKASYALILQAHQLLQLAGTLHSCELADPSLPPNKSSHVGSAASIFFQTEREVELDTRKLARNAYQMRRMRETLFDDCDLFGEPAWDILLDLTNAALSGARVSVSSACVGSCVPTTTALRWLSILERKGLIEREDDLLDGRRTYVRLTREGLAKMEDYLRASGSL